MADIYDNWERLVAAVLRREQDREIARCDSLSTSFSSDFSSQISFSSTFLGDPSASASASVRNSATRAIGAGRIAAGAARLFAAPAIALSRYRRKKGRYRLFDVPDQEPFLRKLQRFSLHELQAATDNFSNKNFIYRGRFSTVYKGRLADGSLVAVQRVKERTPEAALRTQVEVLSMAEHRNVLPLRGFCMTAKEMLLVCPLMINGNVASWLRERPETKPPLDWQMRKRIALGSARGLAYLHDHCDTDTKIIHGNVKAANILLDEDFEAILVGFWVAKLMDHRDPHVTTVVRGTIGYIAPEYLSTGECSAKSDVFSYGVLLLELITGQRAFDLGRLANDMDAYILDWVRGLLVNEIRFETLVDTNLQGNYNTEEVQQLIELALLCTQTSPTGRPEMSEVIRMLEGDGLAERWEVSRQDEHRDTNWIVDDSISDIEFEQEWYLDS